MYQNELPVGFGMALAMDTEAMNKFASLSEEQKQEIIAAAHSVNSKIEMQMLVDSIKSKFQRTICK